MSGYKGEYPCVNHSEYPDRRIEEVGEPRHMCWECYWAALDDELAEIQRHNERRITDTNGRHLSL